MKCWQHAISADRPPDLRSPPPQHAPVAVMERGARVLRAVFHPGRAYDRCKECCELRFEVCGCRGDWTIASSSMSDGPHQGTVGTGRVVFGLSGASFDVAASLIHRAIAIACSALRETCCCAERSATSSTRQKLQLPVHHVDASAKFLDRSPALPILT